MTTVHAESLAFSNRLVENARRRAKRAIAHRDQAGIYQIPELTRFADHACKVSLGQFSNALGKRAFEVRAALAN